MTVIAADVGGSKSMLGWFPAPGPAQASAVFDNHQHDSISAVVQAFLRQQPGIQPRLCTLVMAIAGPVQDQRHCQMTNLPWLIEADSLRAAFGFRQVVLLNDLEATAWAMPCLATGQLQALNGLPPDFGKPVTVISVGTGFGQALLLPDATHGFRVLPSEGGHKSFAPFDATGAGLLQREMDAGKECISWENWFSGSGLPQLFQAMFPAHQPLNSAAITTQGQADSASCAAQCLSFFTRGVFADAGNIALQYWSEGGVVFAGGVAQHIRTWLENPALQAVFSQKSHHQEWLRTVPLALCTTTQAALLGAADFGWHQQMRGN